MHSCSQSQAPASLPLQLLSEGALPENVSSSSSWLRHCQAQEAKGAPDTAPDRDVLLLSATPETGKLAGMGRRQERAVCVRPETSQSQEHLCHLSVLWEQREPCSPLPTSLCADAAPHASHSVQLPSTSSAPRTVAASQAPAQLPPCRIYWREDTQR